MFKMALIACMTLSVTACLHHTCKPVVAPRIDDKYLVDSPIIKAESAEYVDILNWGLRLSETIEIFNARMAEARVANGDVE